MSSRNLLGGTLVSWTLAPGYFDSMLYLDIAVGFLEGIILEGFQKQHVVVRDVREKGSYRTFLLR